MIDLTALSQLTACAGRRWQAGIGDPTLLGWITTAYLLAGLACAAAFVRVARGRERVFWGGVAVVMITLAVNKELDLHAAVTAFGRCVALDQGWYDSRRAVQAGVVLLLAWYGCVAGITGGWMMRRHLGRVGSALLGLVAVLAYVLLRGAGFNHVEPVMQIGGATLQARPWLELGGIALIGANALAALMLRRPRATTTGARQPAR